MQTKIDLCSQALLKIGEPAITSFNADTAASQIASGLYDITIDALLSRHGWRFACKKYKLNKTAGGDFLIPGDVLRIVGSDAAKYEIIGNKIAAAPREIEISAVARVNAESFPAYFTILAITKLAMEFSLPLTGNQNTYAMLSALFESELRSAKFIDSAAEPNKSIEKFSLLSARF